MFELVQLTVSPTILDPENSCFFENAYKQVSVLFILPFKIFSSLKSLATIPNLELLINKFLPKKLLFSPTEIALSPQLLAIKLNQYQEMTF